MVGIFESTIERDRESFRDPKSLEKFLMHFSISILTLNVNYSLQKKEYTIIRLF
jgi:hypothetical protein